MKVCFSALSISEKDVYIAKCQDIGIPFSRFLDSSVTHLITNAPPRSSSPEGTFSGESIFTPKYYAAVERGLPIISKIFIDVAHRDDLKMDAILERILDFKIAPLYGIQISVSGYCQEDRLAVQEICEQMGGIYSPNFTRSFTHLLAPAPTGCKHQYAVLWEIPVVIKDWLFDSAKAGGCLPIDHYLIKSDSTSTSKDFSALPPQVPSSSANSKTDWETICKEIPDNCDPFLSNCDIYLGEGFNVSEIKSLKQIIMAGHGTRHSDFSPDITHFICKGNSLNPRDKEHLESMSRKPEVVTAAWLLDSLRQQKMISTGNYVVIDALKLFPSVSHKPSQVPEEECESGFLKLNLSSKSAKRKPPKQLETSILPNRSLKNLAKGNEKLTPKLEKRTLSACTLPFTGLQFCLRFSKFPEHLSRLSGRIESNGGVILERSLNLDPSVYVVVPYMYFHEAENVKNTEFGSFVTDGWIYKCIECHEFVDPDSCISLYRPLDVKVTNFPILGFEKFNISVTNIDGVDRQIIGEIVELLGGTFSETLTKNSTHLIYNRLEGQKCNYALKWNVKLVKPEWIFDCLLKGDVIPITQDKGPIIQMSLNEKQNSFARAVSPMGSSLHSSLGIKSFKVTNNTSAHISSSSTSSSSLMNKSNVSVVSSSSGVISTSSGSGLTFMSDVVIYVSQRLCHRRKDLFEMISKMGGDYVWSYGPRVTHYIHFGNKVEETFQEFKQMRISKIPIVSPEWIKESFEQKRRLNEADYPHCNSQKSNAEARVSVQEKRSKSHDIRRDIDSASPICDEIPSSSKVPDNRKIDRMIQNILDDKISVVLPVAEDMRVRKRARIVGDVTFSELTKSENKDDFPSKEKDEEVRVTYDSSVGELMEKGKSEIERSRSKGFYFYVSSSSSEIKNRHNKVIKGLGGKVITSIVSEWTHYLTAKPSKSEKFLSACASGKWILHFSYLEACEKAKYFVHEEPYEWGCMNTGRMAVASRLWRRYLSDKGPGIGAFTNWRCLLYVDRGKVDGFISLLDCGGAECAVPGGEIPDSDSPQLKAWISQTSSQYTHIIVETAKRLTVKLEEALNSLSAASTSSKPIYIVKPDFISDFLISVDREEDLFSSSRIERIAESNKVSL